MLAFTLKLVIHFELIPVCAVQYTVEQMWIKIFCGIVIKSRWIPVRPCGLVACKAITWELLHLPSESSQQLPAEVWGSQIRGWISLFSTSPSWGLWYRWCSAHTACLWTEGSVVENPTSPFWMCPHFSCSSPATESFSSSSFPRLLSCWSECLSAPGCPVRGDESCLELCWVSVTDACVPSDVGFGHKSITLVWESCLRPRH